MAAADGGAQRGHRRRDRRQAAARDIDDDAMRVRKLPVPNTHAFTQSEANVEPEETTNDQIATARAMGALAK